MQREFQRDVQALQAVFEFVGEFCASAQIDARTRFVIELTVEELFVNAVEHNPEGKGAVLIELERRNDAAEMAVTDFDADRFDPTQADPPDTHAPLEQRQRGLGIHLVKQMTDDVRYEYRDRTSRTIVKKTLGQAMFEIKIGDQGEIVPVGRLDASRVDQAREFFEGVTSSKTIDLARLEYISSVGIRLLVSTQQRLSQSGEKLKLVNAKDQIKDVFRFAGLDAIFEMD